MLRWAQDIFPFPRSLTGEGVAKTLSYFQAIVPELTVKSVESGFRAFDWIVPQEWTLRDSYLEHIQSRTRFAELKKNNLHIVGYSEPVNSEMPLAELLERIHTLPDQPDWIPYVTSYYSRTWGFCMSHNEKEALPEGDYRVVIDSELSDGTMLMADAVIEGTRSEEIFFSSYVCHPAMANNELSGPVLVVALMKFLTETIKTPRFSYRFVLLPETIGSLTYLQENLDHLKSKVVCGFNLSCVGDNRAYSIVESRLGHCLADSALQAALIGKPNVKHYSFLERGSDERQYCAPGIDLPVAGFCRTKYHEYPEYHTSADDFGVVTEDGLQGSFEVMTSIIQAMEMGLYPKVRVMGEPQLGARGLYPTVSKKGVYSEVATRMNVLAYSDGNHSLFDLAHKLDVPLKEVLTEVGVLLDADLLETSDSPW
jgi:aminopeptidase-like protein